MALTKDIVINYYIRGDIWHAIWLFTIPSMPHTSRQTESERERREKEIEFLFNVIILISKSIQTIYFLTIDNFVILIFRLTVKSS